MTEPTPSALSVWVGACRPKTLWAGFAPVLMGTAMAYADGQFHGAWALVALFSALCLQVSSNLANDYFDFLKGADNQERLGPVRATAAGLVTPEQMKRAMVVALLFSALGCSLMVYRGGMPMVWVGVASLVCAVIYTGGPFPLAYHGLGDVFAFLFFGPVAVAGTHFIQGMSFSWHAVMAGCGAGCFSMAILTVNNLRDIETDDAANKRTLAVRFGANFARTEYVLCYVGALVTPVVLIVSGLFAWYALGVWMLVPLMIKLVRRVNVTNGRALNPLLGETAKCLLFYSIIFSLGMICGRHF